MYYKNIQGLTEVYTTSEIPLKLLIGREGTTLTFVEKIVIELPKMMINKGNSNFTSSNIKTTMPNFKTYTSSFDSILYDLLNSKSFQNLITKDIEEINNNEFKYTKLDFGSKIADQSGIKVVSEMIQNNTETKQQLETKTLYDLQRNPLANSLILKKIQTKTLEEYEAFPML